MCSLPGLKLSLLYDSSQRIMVVSVLQKSVYANASYSTPCGSAKNAVLSVLSVHCILRTNFSYMTRAESKYLH